MGLDMFLWKEVYVGAEYSHRNMNVIIDVTKDGKRMPINTNKVCEIREEAMYWRKANAIHSWFLENCAAKDPFDNPIDDCRPIEIPLEKLEELLDICKEVLEDHSLAKKLLPTLDGFFFGSTEYGEWYFRAIEETINIIEPVIDFMKHMSEIKDCTWDVIYEASW